MKKYFLGLMVAFGLLSISFSGYASNLKIFSFDPVKIHKNVGCVALDEYIGKTLTLEFDKKKLVSGTLTKPLVYGAGVSSQIQNGSVVFHTAMTGPKNAKVLAFAFKGTRVVRDGDEELNRYPYTYFFMIYNNEGYVDYTSANCKAQMVGPIKRS